MNWKYIVSGDINGLIVINHIHKDKCLKFIKLKNRVITSLTLSQDGHKLMIGTNGNEISMWDLNSDIKMREFKD